MSDEKSKTFHDAVSKLLGARLQKYQTESINVYICVKIYQEIFESLVDLFEQSNVNLTNESMNYLAQQYYDGVLINNTQELDPNIFTIRAKLDGIETKEIALMAVMLKGTDFAMPLLAEIKRRA
jgi:hypothetical protein